MEEAALQDYRDKDVHSSRDFTAKVGNPHPWKQPAMN